MANMIPQKTFEQVVKKHFLLLLMLKTVVNVSIFVNSFFSNFWLIIWKRNL